MKYKNFKESIKSKFSKSAAAYDQYVDVQKDMADGLFSLLENDYNKILDLGCGTGDFACCLAQRKPNSLITGVDISPEMIKNASLKTKNPNIKFYVGDGEKLDFNGCEFDLVVSNASIQWMDYKKVFFEVSRVLRPKGCFCFSTFGPCTFYELRTAGFSVNEFAKKEEIKSELSKYFKDIKITNKIIVKKYDTVFDFFNYLRGIGAQNPAIVKKKGLMTKNRILSVFPTSKEGINLTFDVIFGCADKT